MLTEESVAGEERRVELSTVRAFGAAKKFVGSSRQGRKGSGKRQNGLVGVRRSSRREESGNGGARLRGLLGEAGYGVRWLFSALGAKWEREGAETGEAML